jgi:hypothetical protein
MMNPKAMEALKKARELFAQQSADDIPSEAQPIEPIRKPRVVLIPTNAPKFTKETMKEEHKHDKQIDAYVGMSTRKAAEACLAKGISKPSDIAKETGKNVNQIYTALWLIKVAKKKAKAKAKAERLANLPTPKQQADEWNREPTAYEDANYVVLHNKEWYDKEIEKLYEANNNLIMQIQELKTIIKYLEGKVSNV